MAEIRSNGMGVPILFPVGEDGLATVTALHISIRFGLQNTSLWVEREVYDPHTSALLHTVPEVPSTPMMALSFGPSSLAGIGCTA